MAATKPAGGGINASIIAQQIDELGALEQRLLPFLPDIKKMELLKQQIRSHFDASPAAEAFQASGDKYTVMLGPKALTRSINPAKLIRAIGLKVYASISKVTLRDLEASVSKEIVAGVVTADNTGTRSLKIFARSAQ
jgi:hypothetical protein